MFACCCRDTASPRSEAALEIEPEVPQGVQAASRKSAGAAPPAAAAVAAADDQEGRARAAAARAAAADGPDSNAVAAVEAAAAAAASGVASAVAADATAAEARQDARPTQATGPAKTVVISTPKKETAPVRKPLTAPTTQRARRTSVPLESPIEEGVFLMYDASTSTIYALWSQTPQPAALAWLKPLVAIPGHKFKVNGGKQIFFNNAQGWVKFISIANEFPSKLMLLDNFAAAEAPDVQLLQLVESPGAKDESSCVAEAITEYNKLYDLKNVKAVAVVPLSSTLIETGKNLSPQRFLQMGTGEGHAAPIQIKRV
ncbi:hypothetical protein Emag_007523 [Eimeria magna]